MSKGGVLYYYKLLEVYMEDFDEVSEGIIGCSYLILNKEEKKKNKDVEEKE